MHVYIGTRGIMHETERFLKELSCQYLPYQKQDDNGVMQKYMLQTSVRPMMGGIYEICFPAEHLDAMLTTLFGAPGKKKDGSGKTQHSKHQKWIWFLRKMLDVDPLPKTWKTDKMIPCYTLNVEKIGVGIKDDYWVKDGKRVPKGTEGAWEAI